MKAAESPPPPQPSPTRGEGVPVLFPCAARCGWTGGCCAGSICAAATRAASARSASRGGGRPGRATARRGGVSTFAPAGGGGGVLKEGSGMVYGLRVGGEARRVEALRDELQPKLANGEKLEDVRDARPEIRTALERAEHFLGLGALPPAMLAGAAMA